MTAEQIHEATGLEEEEQLEMVKFCAQGIIVRVPGNIEIDDLIQAGMIGLMDARRKYDPTRKNNFKTYAEFRIRGAMLDHLRDADFVPRSVRDKHKRLEAANNVLEFKLGRKPDAEEVAEQMTLTAEQVYQLERLTAPTTFLPSEELKDWASGDRRSLLDVVTGGQTEEEKMVNRIHHKRRLEHVAGYVMKQNPRTRMILDLYWFVGLRLKQIGRRLKISESRCSQIVQRHSIELRRLLDKYEKGQAA